jgi:hypothetical protein
LAALNIKGLQEGDQILGVNQRGVIVYNGEILIGIVVALTIGDHTIVAGKPLHLRR